MDNKRQSDSVDSSKGLHNIENGEANDGDQVFVKKPYYPQTPTVANEYWIPSFEINTSNNSNGNADNHQSSDANSVRHSAIPIPNEDLQALNNCNTKINHTNKSICNTHNAYNDSNNGHAIIDVVSTTHTHTDHSKVTIKSTEQQQLPTETSTYTTSSTPQQPQPSHKNTENTNDVVDVNSNTNAGAAAAAGAAGPEESNRKQQKLSNKIVVVLRRSKPIALVVINSVLAVLIVTSFCISMGMDYTVPAVVVGLIAVVASSGLWYWLYIAAVTAPRDIRALYRYIKLLTLVRRCQRKNVAIWDLFHHYVAKHPQKPCIIYDGQEWTFREMNEFSNRIANLFQQHGYKKGDVVGLFMDNRPEFVATWLGLSKIGVIVPLINTNQRQASLIHSIEIAKCQALIYGESLASAVAEVSERLSKGSFAWYQYNDKSHEISDKSIKNLNNLLEKTPKTDVVSSSTADTHHNQLLYIYTSGTTGLPKAAVITHSRYIFIAAGIHYMADFQPDDIFYTPLPLYHTAGGVMSIGQALLFGSTVVIRKKFSASGYFPDCQKYKCTVAQYIGEMCRYILATPPNAADNSHNVRTIFGNGLRPQIWPQFINRFKIPKVAEFYGATEGNANIVNINNVVGAIGFVSRILPSVYPISVIKADPDTGEPIRDSNGLCQLCKPNEPGVFVGKIMPGNPSRAFLGYVDKAASSKKIVKDVFKKGDSAFLSGDLLVSDEYGNLYFKDRTGDTFRWKGENVSTSEVEAQVSNVAGYRDTVVYGVEIPHNEGRAGMAAILDGDQSIDLDALSTGLKSVLPTYARPQIIRLLNKVDMTGTFKLKKLDLQKEGFDPTKIGDSLYYLSSNGKYCRLDKAVYEQILNGEVRF